MSNVLTGFEQSLKLKTICKSTDENFVTKTEVKEKRINAVIQQANKTDLKIRRFSR